MGNLCLPKRRDAGAGLISADSRDLSWGYNSVVVQLLVVTARLCLLCAHRVKSARHGSPRRARGMKLTKGTAARGQRAPRKYFKGENGKNDPEVLKGWFKKCSDTKGDKGENCW